jgi:CHASE3 domain sensor protein
MGILLLATIINAANGDAEQAQAAARNLAITVTVSIVICVCAGIVWLDGSA